MCDETLLVPLTQGLIDRINDILSVGEPHKVSTPDFGYNPTEEGAAIECFILILSSKPVIV